MNFRFLLSMLFLLHYLVEITIGQPASPVQWTLEEIIDLGLDHGLDMLEANYIHEDAQWSYQQSMSLFKPWITLDGNLPNYTRTVQEIVQPDGSLEFQPIQYNNSAVGLSASQVISSTGGRIFFNSDLQRFDNFATQKKNYNGLPFRFGFEQPLLQFNPLKWTRKLAPLRRNQADKAYLYSIEEFSTRIVQQFFNMVAKQMDLDIATSNQQNNDTLYQIALERHALGKISQNDLLQLKRESIQAKKDLISAEVALDNARDQLSAFLGLSNRLEGMFISPDLPLIAHINYSLAITKAMANHPEKYYYQLKELESQRDLDRAKKMKFGASIQASAGLVRSSPDLTEIYRDPQNEQALSLKLTIPISTGGFNVAEIKKQEALNKFANEEIHQFEKDFQVEVILLCRSLENSVQELNYTHELNLIAQERYTISKNRYLYGDISITDLTLSIREKDLAQREYLQALQSAWINYYKLRAITLFDFLNNKDIDHFLPHFN
ncbi:MAG: TolC family protein [Saprospiraceae bacterium]|nr:TolC family protein [Saprospiraceae bacterium]